MQLIKTFKVGAGIQLPVCLYHFRLDKVYGLDVADFCSPMQCK